MNIVRGAVKKIIFNNPVTGFTVALIEPDDGSREFSAVGELMSPQPGEKLELAGSYEQSKKHGMEFRVQSCKILAPSNAEEALKYLSSGIMPGIGKAMAKRIVKHFGEETFRILDEESERLTEVRGIGTKTAAKAIAAYREKRGLRDITVFLQVHGASGKLAPKVFERYGAGAIALIRKNPYRLALDIEGIGFLTADRIATSMNIPKESVDRAMAYIVHILITATGEGHVAVRLSELKEKAIETLRIPEWMIDDGLKALAEEKKIVIEEVDSADGPVVYPYYLYRYEHELSQKLKDILDAPSQVRPINCQRALKWLSTRLGIGLNAGQSAAVLEAASRKILVLTGGPGTGKTTTVRAILMIFEKLGLKAMLAAPTGRAAKRLIEATGHEAKTIHRLLEYNPMQGSFAKNAENPLESDLLVLDEVSMMDLPLARHLFAAVPDSASVLLVGDRDQLPSVGPGNVLGDIIRSGRIPIWQLTEIFRQEKESLIVANAHRINRGIEPLLPGKGEIADFYFLPEDDPISLHDLVMDLVCRRLPARFGFDPKSDVQVLTPMHKGPVGVQALNFGLQQALNPHGLSIQHRDMVFRVGDRVMQTANDYDRDVFNGDLGEIVLIDKENHSLEVIIDGRAVVYTTTDLDDLVLAYAVSIHKSQGSEYPAVVIPLCTQHYMLLERNLLYTAVTRGKKLVVICGSRKALNIALSRVTPKLRVSYLWKRLSD